jgi:DNA-binding NarL/FixJ family response regulator
VTGLDDDAVDGGGRVDPGAPAGGPVRDASGAAGGPVRVLVCDDEPTIRDALREVLEAEPDLVVVAVAGTADEAIAAAVRHLPDVAVLDVRMPGGGVHAARGIRQRAPHTGLLVFSAYGDLGARDELAAAGVAEQLLKGVPNADLVAAVRRVAATRSVS